MAGANAVLIANATLESPGTKHVHSVNAMDVRYITSERGDSSAICQAYFVISTIGATGVT